MSVNALSHLASNLIELCMNVLHVYVYFYMNAPMYICVHVCMCGFKILYLGTFLLYFRFSFILTLKLQVFRTFLKINYYYYYYYYYYYLVI
jgi:hypothetical protein